jgi:hypothetical protein
MTDCSSQNNCPKPVSVHSYNPRLLHADPTSLLSIVDVLIGPGSRFVLFFARVARREVRLSLVQSRVRKTNTVLPFVAA